MPAQNARAGPGEHDRPHALFQVQVAERLLQLRQHRAGQRIPPAGPVEHDRAHGAGDFHVDGVAGHVHRARSRSRSREQETASTSRDYAPGSDSTDCMFCRVGSTRRHVVVLATSVMTVCCIPASICRSALRASVPRCGRNWQCFNDLMAARRSAHNLPAPGLHSPSVHVPCGSNAHREELPVPRYRPNRHVNGTSSPTA